MAKSQSASIDRREILPRLFPDPEKWLFVSGLGGASRDAAALTGDGTNLYTMAGAMGAAVPMGLGMALSAPNRKVAVINGDGEMLMGIGSLVTVAAARPRNLTIVCQDNAMHGETGGQIGHTAGATNLETIAQGAGIHSTLTISEPSQIADAAAFIAEMPGPRFLVVRVLPTPPSAFKR
ncbi:MAG: thiamine pyrophosphate-dependent enzyme, partial [Gammaproteobacteria bacterium]|nr:thiamine pyrophosphate-dependent enzyme [Gammaproteobacteria bacterium]